MCLYIREFMKSKSWWFPFSLQVSDSLLSGTEATTSTTQTTTQTPGRMTSPPVTVTTPAPNSLPGQMTGSLMMLPFGATVTIPFGSTIFLPSGSQIQMQQQQQTVSTQEQSHQHHEQPTSAVPGHSHHHHQHRSGSASSDVVDAMNAPGNIESQSADSNTDFDYYFDDEGLSDASATPVGGQWCCCRANRAGADRRSDSKWLYSRVINTRHNRVLIYKMCYCKVRWGAWNSSHYLIP